MAHEGLRDHPCCSCYIGLRHNVRSQRPEQIRAEAGFTLLELIIVLFLISLVLALGAGFFVNSLPGAKLSATTREISAVIRQAKSLAQNRGESVALIFDLDRKQYGIENGQMRNMPPDLSILINDPDKGEQSVGKYSILFQATGGAQGVGAIVLSSRRKTVRIEMDPVVGSVVVRE